jgi:excinuclease ABC subunit A
MDTLSVGEFQRLKLAKQISGKLTGILYLFDEPTVGLHPQEIELLTQTIKSLTENGNTVVAIEHDEQLIREADKIVDLGPGPGKQGGQVLAEGSFSQLLKNTRSLTGKYLSGKLLIKTPLKRRKAGEYIEIIGANKHNLKGINIKIPVGLFTCITGVSGAGKSTLVEEVIYRALRYSLGETSVRSDGYQEVRGREKIKGVINVTQAPLTPTTLSTPVTYTKAFDYIRDFFASLPESRKRGYSPSRFSFNLKGGRCEACQGQGEVKVEIPLLGIEYQRCEICQGKRYTDEVLEITYQGKNIAEILNLSVREAEVVFRNIPKIKNILSVLREVGLDYIKLGQPASSLSGGEAQRVKIARELSRGARKKILYILDEPTRGLHFWDIAQLIQSLQRLVDKGNTLVVIEHNLEVIKAADYIIELGPGAGDEGGKIVSQGTPEEVANTRKSIIGQYLKRRLN